MKSILPLNPMTVSEFISNETTERIIGGISNHLLTQESGACFWCVTEDIKLLKVPVKFKGCNRFRLVVPTNHKGNKMEVIGCFLFCPDEISNKEAIELSKENYPVQSLS